MVATVERCPSGLRNWSWKPATPQTSVGSNPTLTAKFLPGFPGFLFLWATQGNRLLYRIGLCIQLERQKEKHEDSRSGNNEWFCWNQGANRPGFGWLWVQDGWGFKRVVFVWGHTVLECNSADCCLETGQTMSAGLPLFLRKALTLTFTYCIIKTLNLMKGKLHDVCCYDEQTE